MSRPPLPLGGWGDIAFQTLGDGRIRARGAYRERSGRVRDVTALGSTEAEAEQKLAAKMRAPLPRKEAVGRGLTETSTLLDLALYFLEKRRMFEDGRPQTLDRYEWTIRTEFTEAVGSIRIAEATTPVLEAILMGIAARSRPAMRRIRLVLSLIFQEAARLGLVTASPVTLTSKPPTAPKDVQAISASDVLVLRKIVHGVREASEADS